ncbi:MAG: Holliday junction branch migration protein RuvA [Legionella sp.]|nr:MAG: Holliday junction branch migration protein RuvA [Legionella sp.]PJD99303.1 MAG: Holliday junction branch migration protein RuvA [Legionella sp.]
MIGWLKGHIIEKEQPGKIVLDVNGVGYDVETSLNTFFQIEQSAQKIELYIHTVVREDALLLYGFFNQEERALFRALIKVNGVGPKSAIAILSSISPSEFIQAIQQENAVLLTKLPGIGKKTAERLVVEMRDGMKQLSSHYDPVVPMQAKQQDEAISALEALGYKTQEAHKAVSKIDDGKKTCEQLIREALQVLATR